jgi:hypothetical protein
MRPEITIPFRSNLAKRPLLARSVSESDRADRQQSLPSGVSTKGADVRSGVAHVWMGVQFPRTDLKWSWCDAAM